LEETHLFFLGFDEIDLEVEVVLLSPKEPFQNWIELPPVFIHGTNGFSKTIIPPVQISYTPSRHEYDAKHQPHGITTHSADTSLQMLKSGLMSNWLLSRHPSIEITLENITGRLNGACENKPLVTLAASGAVYDLDSNYSPNRRSSNKVAAI
jgi:hypothetical protein